MSLNVILVVCAVCLLSINFVDSKNSFETKYVDVPLDHFSSSNIKTFKIRYLVNGHYHIKGGPIFIYTGNEGDISMFSENTGFLFEIAPVFNALIVFAEHRYYGKSLPFGSSSLDKDNTKYLSTAQALGDFVYVIEELKKTYLKNMLSNDTFPFIAFGGSYGGMLAAWLRMKYPNTVAGAIAASAPIWYFDEDIPCGKFYDLVTRAFEKYGTTECTKIINLSWSVIRNVTKTKNGKEYLSAIWKTCGNISTETDVDKLVRWLTDIYVDLAMVNYPYPANFIASLPAYPVQVFCEKLVSSKSNESTSFLEGLGTALELFTNYTGKSKCNNINKTIDELDEKAWDYQVCTELVMPRCSNEKDMFETVEWDLKKYNKECDKKFGAHVFRTDWPSLQYGGKNLRYFSNIVFSNGLLDPWSYAGVLQNITANILAVNIIDGAHHVDLRTSDPADNNYVIQARKFHIKAIRKFLNL